MFFDLKSEFYITRRVSRDERIVITTTGGISEIVGKVLISWWTIVKQFIFFDLKSRFFLPLRYTQNDKLDFSNILLMAIYL